MISAAVVLRALVLAAPPGGALPPTLRPNGIESVDVALMGFEEARALVLATVRPLPAERRGGARAE